MKTEMEYLRGLGLKRRHVSEVLGVNSSVVDAWTAGRSRPTSECLYGAVEAIRVLEAGLGRERALKLILGHSPQRWMVAMATLACAVAGEVAGAGVKSDMNLSSGAGGATEPAAPVPPAPGAPAWPENGEA